MKMTIAILLFLLSATPSYFALTAQAPTGQWEMTLVTVGSDTMTPVAKWIDLSPAGSFRGGNGGLQHEEGRYNFDPEKNTLLLKIANGILDSFGPFLVTREEDKMHWQREEEGQMVTVYLRKVTQLPKGTADKVVGLWKLKDVIRNGKSIMDDIDPDRQHHMYVRWDRIYVGRDTNGTRISGYWHVHAHRPELTLLPHEEGEGPSSWMAEIQDNQLILNGHSDRHQATQRIYTRLNTFPR